VNGKPVYYYKNADMQYAVVPADAGEVIAGNVTNLTVDGVYISGADTGILIGYSSHIRIRNSRVNNNSLEAICLYYSDGNVIENSIVSNNTENSIYSAIFLYYSDNNIVSNNTVSGLFLHRYNVGIYLVYSGNNIVSNNTVHDIKYGIEVFGIVATGNEIVDNDVYNNIFDGIYLRASGNVIRNNSVHSNGYSSSYHGIRLLGANDNQIYNNSVYSNTGYGIYISSGSNNLIYNNTFSYNHGSGDTYSAATVQAYDGGTNNWWNTTSGYGNYWNDWANNNATNDANGDGIIDWPYPIDGSAGARDYYPLANPTVVPEFSTWSTIVLMAVGLLLALIGGRRR